MLKKIPLRILIVNWNNKNVLLECLRSIRDAGYEKHTLVVDNNSSDASVRALQKDFPGVQILELNENAGYSGGNNLGIKLLIKQSTDYIFILNPDTIICKDTIPKLFKALKSTGRTGIVGPKIYDMKGKIWSCGGVIDKKRFTGGLIGFGENDTGQYDQAREVDYIPGTAMLIKKEVLEEIGLFEEKYFIYYEDTELSVRARKAGYQIAIVPQAIINHKESSSFGKKSEAHSYYMARNHLLFLERNAPIFTKARELIRLPKTIWEHMERKEKWAVIGIKDYFLRRFNRRDYWS